VAAVTTLRVVSRLCAIAHLRRHRSAMVPVSAFTSGDTKMHNRSRTLDAVFLLFMTASFVMLSGVLGPWPLLWLR